MKVFVIGGGAGAGRGGGVTAMLGGVAFLRARAFCRADCLFGEGETVRRGRFAGGG